MFSTPLVPVESRHRGDHRYVFLDIDVNQEIRYQGGFYFEELDTEMMVQQCQIADFELEQSGISLTDGMENFNDHIFLSSGNESIQINGEFDESLNEFEFKEDGDFELR